MGFFEPWLIPLFITIAVFATIRIARILLAPEPTDRPNAFSEHTEEIADLKEFVRGFSAAESRSEKKEEIWTASCE